MVETSSGDSPRNAVAPLPPIPPVLVGNQGQPILLSEVNIDGVAAEPARSGETCKVWTRLALTSDDPMFHKIAEGLTQVITHRTRAAGVPFAEDRTRTILIVIKPDRTAELWADAAAVSMSILTKRGAMKAGTLIFEHDIVDVTAMAFPLVKIAKEDKVICLFRQDWRFGLYFDFNPEGNLSLDHFHRTLGSLYRNLKYRHIYDAIGQPAVFDRLVGAGWFPFAEIISSEFRELASACEAGFDLNEVETRMVASFDATRLDRMLERWLVKPHFASRALVLRSATKNFLGGDPVAVIKTVLTEIEGILNAAYHASHGTGSDIKTLLKFAIDSAEKRAGSSDTLLLPLAFAEFLKKQTFATFDPRAGLGDARSRHAVGHGAAAAETYTMVAALQALLTLDQFAFSI